MGLRAFEICEGKGPKVTRVIGETMGLNFDADLAGDAYVFWRLRGLGSSDLAHPLVALSGDPYDMRDCQSERKHARFRVTRIELS
jgi:hypothetical protein